MPAEYSLAHYPPGVWSRTALDRVVECGYARGENVIGEMTLTLPDFYYDPSLFKVFDRFIVERSLPGVAPYADLDTVWFAVDDPLYTLDESGLGIVVIECMDALGFILSGAAIPYQQYSEQAYKLAPADDMGKALVRENLGALATDTARDLSTWMTVAPDRGAAPIIRLNFEFEYVLDALQKIAKASAADDATPTWMGFDIALANPATGLLEFRTYTGQRGQDHRFPGGSPPLTLSPNTGTLSRPSSGRLWREAATVVYAGGTNVGDLKPIATAQDDSLLALSPFARREIFHDTQATDADSLQAEANAELRRRRPRRFATGTVIEANDALRGVHWDYGDFLTADHRGPFDARVEKIGVTLKAAEGGGLVDSVAVLLRGESDAIR